MRVPGKRHFFQSINYAVYIFFVYSDVNEAVSGKMGREQKWQGRGFAGWQDRYTAEIDGNDLKQHDRRNAVG